MADQMEIDNQLEEQEIEEEEQEQLDELQIKFQDIEDLEALNLASSTKQYEELLSNKREDDIANKVKEKCVYKLADQYSKDSNLDLLLSLIKEKSAHLLSVLPKAKAARVVRISLKIVQTNLSKIPESKEQKSDYQQFSTYQEQQKQLQKSSQLLIPICEQLIQWCINEKRTFLRQRIQAKLSNLYLDNNEPLKSLQVSQKLLTELKKLDDKSLLVESYLSEAKAYQSLSNLSKAKASLTQARSCAAQVFILPNLQAEVDEVAGSILLEEGDSKIAHSYFHEALDGYIQCGEVSSAAKCLGFMLICVALQNENKQLLKQHHRIVLRLEQNKKKTVTVTDDASADVENKENEEKSSKKKKKISMVGISQHPFLVMLEALTTATHESSLKKFLQTLVDYAKTCAPPSLIPYITTSSFSSSLGLSGFGNNTVKTNNTHTEDDLFTIVTHGDKVLARSIKKLRDILLEINLIKIIQPYSCVDIEYISKKIELPLDIVQNKLSQLILDDRLYGTLDQGNGHLILNYKKEGDKSFNEALNITNNLNNIVDILKIRAKELHN